MLLLFGKRVGVAGRNRPAEVGGEGRALSTAAREETSSPQKNAYRVPGLRFTQRTKDMVYIGLENLLPFPLLRWPLPGLLFGMAEGSHMRELAKRTARGQCERRCTRPNIVHCAIASRTKTPRKIQLFPARYLLLEVKRTPDS